MPGVRDVANAYVDGTDYSKSPLEKVGQTAFGQRLALMKDLKEKECVLYYHTGSHCSESKQPALSGQLATVSN